MLNHNYQNWNRWRNLLKHNYQIWQVIDINLKQKLAFYIFGKLKHIHKIDQRWSLVSTKKLLEWPLSSLGLPYVDKTYAYYTFIVLYLIYVTPPIIKIVLNANVRLLQIFYKIISSMLKDFSSFNSAQCILRIVSSCLWFSLPLLNRITSLPLRCCIL